VLNHRRQQGFSLLELAIVLVIVGLLLATLAMPLGARVEQARLAEARRQLDDVRQALVGHALAFDALPCPATPGSNGLAAATATGCTVRHGFVPAATLGLGGGRNRDNLLLDPWGNPLRYSVSASDANGDARWDFTVPGNLRAATMAALAPDLRVCSTAAGSTATSCGSAATTVATGVPAVVLSMGRDYATTTSADQLENVGATLGGGPSGTAWPVAADNVFVSRTAGEATGNEYDDSVTWVTPATLYGALVAAGRLP
jgi:prepilin-type N-terminal cleavage/methylation domain-containing protein